VTRRERHGICPRAGDGWTSTLSGGIAIAPQVSECLRIAIISEFKSMSTDSRHRPETMRAGNLSLPPAVPTGSCNEPDGRVAFHRRLCKLRVRKLSLKLARGVIGHRLPASDRSSADAGDRRSVPVVVRRSSGEDVR
jgi:hypothetical protein